MNEPGIHLCEKCGYDLAGLPRHGRCPECGNPFNKETLAGIKKTMETSPVSRTDRMLRRLRTIALAVAAVMVTLCAGGVSMFNQSTGIASTARPLYIGGFIAVLCLLAALTSYLYEHD